MANDAIVTSADERVVLTLDAGGTSFRFSAMQAGRPCAETFVLPTCGDDLARCFENLVAGFETARQRCPAPPVALSFAFPGPADYPNGIIGDLPNLPAFRGGVPLGPMLENRFGLPVFLNNDGDLFTFGEATGGLLPWVNAQLAAAGSPKRFRNLLGLTLGTGLGGGLARDGEMWTGDNSLAAEVHLFRHRHDPRRNAEEGASLRAVRRVYAEHAGRPLADVPDAETICAIALGQSTGNADAARASFRALGEVVGDVLAHALSLVDGLVVIGGGLSAAWPLFAPAACQELQRAYACPDGSALPRLNARVFDFENAAQLPAFLAGEPRELAVPGCDRVVRHDALPRTGLGRSRLGTSAAIALGAYHFALRRLDPIARARHEHLASNSGPAS